MKKIFLLQAFLWPALTGFSQDGPGQYNYYSSNDKKTVFRDGFSDNRNNWSNDTADAETTIENGYMRVKTGAESLTMLPDKVTVDGSKDFELEMQVRYIKSEWVYFVSGLYWGAGKEGNGYIFGHNYRKSCLAFKWHKPDNDKLFSGKAEDKIDLSGYNLLTVRKAGDHYYFFINKKFISKSPYQAFYGNRLGVWLAPHALIYVDNYMLSYLDKAVSKTGIGEKEEEEELSYTMQEQLKSRKRELEKEKQEQKNKSRLILKKGSWPLEKETQYAAHQYSSGINIYINRSDDFFHFGKLKETTITGFDMNDNWRIGFYIHITPASAYSKFVVSNDAGRQLLTAIIDPARISLGWLNNRFNKFIVDEDVKVEGWKTGRLNHVVIEHMAKIVFLYLNDRLLKVWYDEKYQSRFGSSSNYKTLFYLNKKGTFNLKNFTIEQIGQ